MRGLGFNVLRFASRSRLRRVPGRAEGRVVGRGGSCGLSDVRSQEMVWVSSRRLSSSSFFLEQRLALLLVPEDGVGLPYRTWIDGSRHRFVSGHLPECTNCSANDTRASRSLTRLVATYDLKIGWSRRNCPSRGCSPRENTGIPEPATLMSGLKQKRRGVCWLERGCAGLPTARLPRLPLRMV